MAQSPTRAGAEGDLKGYRTGWKAMFRLMKEGLSWSGREANCAFLNLDGRRFADVSGISGFDFKDDGRALALVDWDRDGRLDLWSANRSAPQLRFLHNRTQGGHFVALRLKGSGRNTQAIGARVELTTANGGSRRLLRTLHAGDGYLSQSSKWLHFGLGSADRIEQVVVRWPDGLPAEETFDGVLVDGWFELEQGSGRAVAVPRRESPVRLTAAPVEIPPASERARAVLVEGPPLPPLEYLDAEGRSARLEPPTEARARLVNLWASWCAPCRAELQEFAERANELEKAGVEVLALSVDEPGDRAKAARLLEELEWPFGQGFASTELVEALDVIQKALVSRRRRMPLPTSFLVTGSGEIAAIYKGPLDVDVLVADAELGSLDPVKRRYAASPLEGRWLFTTYATGGVGMRIARELRDHGLHAAAAGTLERLNVPRGDDPTSVADRRVWLKAALEVAERLVEEGHPLAAAPLYRRFVELEPTAVDGWLLLGDALADGDQGPQAVEAYRAVLELRPRHPTAPTKLAALLLQLGKPAEAVPVLERVVGLRPDQWRGHWLLARALVELGRSEEAARHLRRSLELHPDHPEARDLLQRLQG